MIFILSREDCIIYEGTISNQAEERTAWFSEGIYGCSFCSGRNTEAAERYRDIDRKSQGIIYWNNIILWWIQDALYFMDYAMIARKRKHVTGRNRVQILENHKRTRMMMARFNRFRTLTDSRSGIFARSTDSPTMQHFQDAQRIPSLRRKQSHFWQTRSSRMAFQWYFTSSCPTGRWLIPLQRQQARNQNYWTLYIT